MHAAIPELKPPGEYASYTDRLPHDPLEHLRRSPPDVGLPYSLHGPYKLRHGGAKGDKQGAVLFSKVWEQCTEHLRHAVREELYLQDLQAGAPDPAT